METSRGNVLIEKDKIEKMSDDEKKSFYKKWLETHREKTDVFVEASLDYAQILYREGKFRRVMDVLMPIVLNYSAYPFSENLIACLNQMGLAVNCESEYSMARHFFQMALEMAETHHVSSVYSKQHNNIGLTYHDQNLPEEAEREYKMAEVWITESDKIEIIGSMVYGNWANILVEQKRWAEALEKYQKGIAFQIDSSEDLDNQYLGMVIYFHLGLHENYQEAKRNFSALIGKQEAETRAFYYWKLLTCDIAEEDKALAEDGYRELDLFLKNPDVVYNWKGRVYFAELLYEKAQKEKNTDAMLEALKRITEIQLEAVNATEKKRIDSLNEYITISLEKQAAIEEANSANQAKTQFLSNMSHDIRTPMNAILGITQLMEHDKNDPQKLEDHISKLKSSSRHLLSLINDVLDMSKIESSEVTLNRESVNLADQIAQLRSIIYPQMEERNQKFAIRIHDITHENFWGDGVRLRQILINLLSNAVKYTPNGGNISLDLTEKYAGEEHRTVFEFVVTDNGYGMSEEFIEHIFEPFTRAENSRTNRIQGTGLGMAITKNIVDIMGGTIELTSKLGKGSCFTVTLPAEIDDNSIPPISAEEIVLIANEKSLIQNATTALNAAQVKLDVMDSVENAEIFLKNHKVDAILLAETYTQEAFTEAVKCINKVADTARVIFCVDYEQKEFPYEVMKECGVHKVITRPIFLTELSAALYQPTEEVTGQNTRTENILQGMRFLCAEDNELNAEILEAILEMEGASCTILSDGKQIVDAFEKTKPHEYDAILMDMQMPVMDGLEATKAIRHSSNQLGKTIPIIAMTANAFSSDVQECLNVGMDAHIPKPVDVQTLKQTINTVMGLKYSGGGGRLSAIRGQD